MKTISKTHFCYIIKQIEKQLDKDKRLVDFLCSEYIDGYPVPTISNDSIDSLCKLLSYQFEGDAVFTEKYENWIDWFVLENDFGEKKHSCFLTNNNIKKEYIIENTEIFYDFLIEYIKNINQ